ncbi:Integrase catalytic domain-containing protein [Citrus sinensis]|nr:Integrase catalytic domain-containing protein [Citrus sinensis]
MKKRKCFYCKKQGHYIRDCAEKKRNEKERTGDATVASDDSSDDGYHSVDLLVASNNNIKEMFDGSVQTLSDVRHAPKLKRNLISLGMLNGMGYSFKSENGGLKIMNETEMVMRGVKKNGLYVLEGSSVPGAAAMPAVSDVNRTMLWHLRLGHMSIRGMQELSKQGLLCGDNIDELDFCENCIFGKAHRSKFTKGMHVSKQPLDYVHADLWGPAQVPSLSGGRYFMSVIDDYSRKELGVRRHKTVRFTTQQNGLAERMNRTLVDKTRCLLINSKLPRSLWAKAISTASYLVNKSSSSAIGFKTPEELWSGRPGKYEHLRVFGCPAYVHVRQGKLDARAVKWVFVGYPDGVKGYRVWCREANKCLISRNVQFNEVAMINNSDQATSTDDINTSDTQATIKTDQGEKIEVELSKDYEDKIQPEAVEAESQDAEVTEGNRKIVSCKWIFKKNEGIPGVEDSRYKARLVARGFTQNEGIDFNEIFSLVVKHSSIRILLAMVALFDLELGQMDVKTAFLHGNLEEKILMSQPEGFKEQGHEEHVCLLKRSLYGLKQSPRQWYRRFDQFMISNGYYRSKYDSCVYHGIINSGGNSRGAVYLLLYVADILIAGKNLSDIKKLKNLLKGKFEMKDLGSAKRILGIDIVRDRTAGTLFLSQSRYISKVLERFQMMDSKPVLTPLGAQFKLSEEMFPTSDVEEDAVKWVLRYLKGTLDHGLMYGKSKHEVCEVRGYIDFDFAGDSDRRKSISGYLFMLDSCLISWKATLQHIVALSSTEAEFVAATEAVKESMRLRGLLNELWLKQKTLEIFYDNQSAIQLIKNQVYHERTKHIDVKLHFIRDEVAKGSVAVIKINTDINPADMLTKVLPTAKFKFCVDLIGVGSSSSP